MRRLPKKGNPPQIHIIYKPPLYPFHYSSDCLWNLVITSKSRMPKLRINFFVVRKPLPV